LLVGLVAASALLIPAAPALALLGTAYQMQLGNPSGATTDTNNHDHYLIQRSIQALDYSDNLGQPVWASWDLTAADLGTNSSGSWSADTNLPPNFYRVPTTAYVGSGYDRGHLCPSADRSVSEEKNDLTYVMSNVMPQAGNQNSGVWKQFEDYCRSLATNSYEIMITCGPSGFGTNRLSSNTNIAIPSNTWKVVVVVAPGAGSVTNRVTATSRVIALSIPNLDSAGSNAWQTYVTNALAIEADAGFTFFNALDPNLAAVLRGKVDGQTPPPPVITDFSPTSGGEGTTVTITGANLNFTTNVTFNGDDASFTIDSSTNLTAIVPFGATSGQIVVSGLGGTGASPGSFILGTNGPVDLTLAVTHTSNFTQGDVGDTYTIIVTNDGTGPSSNTVTVTATLPASLTATALGGSGWTSDLGTLTCTCTNRLLPGGAYPPITLTVNVSSSAPASVTTTAMVAGRSDTNPDNNTASDPTPINPASAPAATTGLATGVGLTNATFNGTVNPNGQPASVCFDYGLTTNYGSTASLVGTLTGTTLQAVSVSLTGLVSGATYHFRVAATNVLGSAVGLDQTFTTITTLVGWDVRGLGNYGPSPLSPSTNAYHLTVVSGLARGAGVGTAGTGATNAWGGTTWTDTSSTGAITANRFVTFTIAANSGYRLSLGSISRFDYRRSDTGPTDGLLQYQLNSGPFTDIAQVSYPSASDSGASLDRIDLTAISALQDIGAGTNVTFCIVNWGGTSSVGKWYIYDMAGSTAPDFTVQGIVAPANSPAADLAISLSHIGDFTQGDTARTYTVIVTNSGPGATAGAVTVTNLLPAGLVATALGGSGWDADLGTLTCARSDALTPGAAYSLITVTVDVLTNAPASVTNTVTVSGGGENNTANNLASDPTTIVALAPVELWRLYWFGTTADSGPAADMAVNTADGMPNLLKYALALNPLEPTNSPTVGDIDTGYLRLTTPRNPDATGVSFHVEVTASLPAGWTTNGTTVDLDTPTLLRAHYDTPVVSSGGGYIRLRVSRP